MNEVKKWERIYQLANDFQDRAPWKVLSDVDRIGVQDPQSDRIGWCVVLGGAGIEEGLTAFIGDAGFHLADDVTCDIVGPDEVIEEADSLALFYGTHDFLAPNEAQVCQRLKFKPRSRDSWPIFRCFKPGFHPWFLEDNEIIFLEACLEQVLEVARQKVEGTEPLPGEDEDTVLVRYRTESNEWHSRIVPLPDDEGPDEPLLLDDELLIRRLGRKKAGDSMWLIDVFGLPEPVQDEPDSRPFYGIVALPLDITTGLIPVAPEPVPPTPNRRTAAARTVLTAIDQAEKKPQEIKIIEPQVFNDIEELGSRIGIRFVLEDPPEGYEEFKEGLLDSLLEE